jgi:hypothetical protein
MTDAEHYRALLEEAQRRLADSEERADALIETCQHIEADLNSTMPEFVETTGKQPYAYYGWRRSAKAALLYKEREIEAERKRHGDLEADAQRIATLVKVAESSYRGEDTSQLLRAMLHMTNDIIAATNYAPSEEQDGLIACVTYQLNEVEAVSAG